MRKVGILAISALALSLLLAGITFADQDTLRNQNNFRSGSSAYSPGYDPAGMAFNNPQIIGDDQVGSFSSSDDSRKMTEHYGQAPMWEDRNEAVSGNTLRESP